MDAINGLCCLANSLIGRQGHRVCREHFLPILWLGNRLIMMDAGRIIVDLDAEQKSRLAVSDLVEQFERASGKRFVDDSLLLRHRDEG